MSDGQTESMESLYDGGRSEERRRAEAVVPRRYHCARWRL
jgi:hypothetical protein